MSILFSSFTRILWALIFLGCLSPAHGKIFDDNQKILPEVVEIFKTYKELIEAEKSIPPSLKEKIFNSSSLTLKDLNTVAQKVFLRPGHLERYELEDFNLRFLPMTDEKTYDLFAAIGDMEGIAPSHPTCDRPVYILINGATVNTMRARLFQLVRFIKEKKICITPDMSIVFLTGKRALFPHESALLLQPPFPLPLNPSWVAPSHLPPTEDQAAAWILAQSQLPEELKTAKIILVSADKQQDPQTKEWRRPTTKDTVDAWITQHHPAPGHCISLSNQPYVYYQEAVIRGAFKEQGLLEKGFTIEGVGGGILDRTKQPIAILLDNLARTLYTEMQNSLL
jgi:hypothetical protein